MSGDVREGPEPVVRCARCGFPAPVLANELAGDGGGDPSLLVVIPVPDGWIGDPESDGIIHGDCAELGEIKEWMADLATIERFLDEEDT